VEKKMEIIFVIKIYKYKKVGGGGGGVENSEQFGHIKLRISHNIVSELRKDS